MAFSTNVFEPILPHSGHYRTLGTAYHALPFIWIGAQDECDRLGALGQMYSCAWRITFRVPTRRKGAKQDWNAVGAIGQCAAALFQIP
jgi:hypothetical protein